MKKRNWKVFLGKLSDLWTIPLALIIAWQYEKVCILLGIFSFTPEKVGKIIPALVLYLLILGISRVIHWAQYPDVYRYGLMKNSNTAWEKLTEQEKFKYSWLQRVLLAFLLAVVLWGM